MANDYPIQYVAVWQAYPGLRQIDHIIAEQHRGKTQLGNLCLACPRCNKNKGPFK